jgi:hypothetical protein
MNLVKLFHITEVSVLRFGKFNDIIFPFSSLYKINQLQCAESLLRS